MSSISGYGASPELLGADFRLHMTWWNVESLPCYPAEQLLASAGEDSELGSQLSRKGRQVGGCLRGAHANTKRWETRYSLGTKYDDLVGFKRPPREKNKQHKLQVSGETW